MKTIFRFFNLAILLAAITSAGAVVGFGQDPCSDAAGKAALDAVFRENYPKGIAERKKAVDAGKQFLEKYGACPDVAEFATYLKTNVPLMEARIRKEEEGARTKGIIDRFNAGLNSKNWDDVYASGKQLMDANPEDFRAVELVLGSIGLDETAKSPRVTKWNEDTLKYARMSIADLEAGKKFSAFGVKPFIYKSKDDALGWMNYTIGLILALDKNNKKEAVSYLYKATQLQSDTATNPVVFDTIGLFYFDEVNRLTQEVKDLIKTQADTDTPEVKTQKIGAIKAKVAVLNGTAERALDVYSRAYKLAPTDAKSKPYRDGLYKTLQDIYRLRFEKLDGIDTWIAAAPSRPMPNPTTPVTPVSDTEPGSTTGSTTAPATPVAPAAAKPAGTAKPAATTPTKPAAATPAKPISTTVKPTAGAKLQVARKPVAKK